MRPNSKEKGAIMKNTHYGAMLVSWMFLVSTGSSAITVGLDPIGQEVTVGSSIEVGVTISDLGTAGAPSLSAFDLDVSFDDSILAFVGATFGDPQLGDQLDLFGLGGNPVFTDLVAPGLLNLGEVSLVLPADLNALQAEGFTLATITVDALSVGLSPLVLSINDLADADGDPLVGGISSGSINVSDSTAVSEPHLLVLLGIGLGGLLAMRFKRIG